MIIISKLENFADKCKNRSALVRSIILSLIYPPQLRNTIEWKYFKRRCGMSHSKMENLAVVVFGPIKSIKDVYVIDITTLKEDCCKVYKKHPWLRQEIKVQLEIFISQ